MKPRAPMLQHELSTLLQNWENMIFQYCKGENATQIECLSTKLDISYLERCYCNSSWALCYKTQKTWDFIIIKVILNSNWTLCYKTEKLWFHYYKGDIAAQIEYIATKIERTWDSNTTIQIERFFYKTENT